MLYVRLPWNGCNPSIETASAPTNSAIIFVTLASRSRSGSPPAMAWATSM
jgi:hypothetical protein